MLTKNYTIKKINRQTTDSITSRIYITRTWRVNKNTNDNKNTNTNNQILCFKVQRLNFPKDTQMTTISTRESQNIISHQRSAH